MNSLASGDEEKDEETLRREKNRIEKAKRNNQNRAMNREKRKELEMYMPVQDRSMDREGQDLPGFSSTLPSFGQKRNIFQRQGNNDNNNNRFVIIFLNIFKLIFL